MIQEFTEKKEFIKTIHYHFAEFISKKYECKDEVGKSVIFLTSYITAAGHTCLSLETIANKKLNECVYDDIDAMPEITIPSFNELEHRITQCLAFGNGVDKVSPLVYSERSCYLYRYWNYENIISTFFKRNAQQGISANTELFANVEKNLSLFKKTFSKEQKLAQLTALTHRACVISGGPGTGKTTVIAAIVYQLLKQQPNCAIALCAPTGKAASRLMQALSQFKEENISEDIKGLFPVDASTIHRLLGYQKGELEFYYNEDNPLPCDVVIVDECSMVDVPLMSRLLKALKQDARIILVGDKDQLSSVEAGAFFGDVCWGALHYSYTNEGKKLLGQCSIPCDDGGKEAHSLRDSIVILHKTYRFSEDSGIAALAESIRTNDVKKAITVLDNSFNDVECREYDSLEWLYSEIAKYSHGHFAKVVSQSFPDAAFAHIVKKGILTPFNRGPWGVETVNQILEQQFTKGIFEEWYHGRVIMITANDYNLQVFNGDIGIYNKSDSLVYFASTEGYRGIHASLLTNYVPAYSITVHKSQGSEFEDVVLILPHVSVENNENWKMLLTRELLYTAVTRAQKKLTILGKKDLIVAMINNPTMRTSGIRNRIWNN